ncbi:MAG: S8 family serine peptidase [Thermoleophilaceae bacterium]|nr:S8 family serine peptidase [Thermoleophilaceae bacterium]
MSVRASGGGELDFDAYTRGIERCSELRRSGVSTILLEVANNGASPQQIARLRDSVVDARDESLSIVAAAGNTGGPVSYPAAIPEVLAVGAVGGSRAACDFSARGAEVDISAPGCGVSVADSAAGCSAPPARAVPRRPLQHRSPRCGPTARTSIRPRPSSS